MQAKEDHEVYISGESEVTLCGCALALALIGSWGNLEGVIRFARQRPITSPQDFADLLNIPVGLAIKIDDLHRIERVPAREIARRLKAGEI
jgi:hypothetical protein